MHRALSSRERSRKRRGKFLAPQHGRAIVSCAAAMSSGHHLVAQTVRAQRLTVIPDAGPTFAAMAEAMDAARRSIFIVGWEGDN